MLMFGVILAEHKKEITDDPMRNLIGPFDKSLDTNRPDFYLIFFALVDFTAPKKVQLLPTCSANW